MTEWINIMEAIMFIVVAWTSGPFQFTEVV